MAGRLLQKVTSASGISRSSFLVANGRGTSATVAAPKVGLITLSHLFHKAAVHPSSVVSKIPAYRGSLKIPRAPANPSKDFPSNCGINGFASRSFNCSDIDAKTTFLTTPRVPSIISNCMKPSKRSFSSHGSKTQEEWQAKFDANEAKSAAELAAMDADNKRFMKTQMWLWSFSCFSCLVGIRAELELKRRRNMKNGSSPGL